MAHELEIRDGQACMMYAGETPWHKLGTRVEKEVTAAACMRLAGLDWEVEKRPLYIHGKADVDGVPVIGEQIDTHFGIVRKEDDKVMGVVGKFYEPIQNVECFDFMDDLVGSGQALYHTAGSLFGGRRIFIAMKLPEDMKIGDDRIERYLLLSTSHDGSLALNVRITPIRVVCANTLGAALAGDVQASFNVRHMPNYKGKVAEAREVLGLAEAYYQRMELEFHKMLDAKYSEGQITKLTQKLFPATVETENGKLEPSVFAKKNRERVIQLFHEGMGNEAVANTRWAAFNAVTEWASHERSTVTFKGQDENEVRMKSLMFGSAGNLIQQAYNALVVK